MFFFRCCMRIDCGCQNEPEAEVPQSSRSSCEKQSQCRLLPQTIDASCTKHFVDYSGCSHTTTDHSLRVSSPQSVDYEEILCISVSPERENDELNSADATGSVICKPPCSIGVFNNNFSPDTLSSNNNLLWQESNDNVKSVQHDDAQNGSGTDECSNVSSASSNVDDDISAEVKYVAVIRHFPPTHTSVGPHGEECRCPTCQSLVEDLNEKVDTPLVHHSSDFTCSCKSCREFYSRLQCAAADSQNIKLPHESASISTDRRDPVSGAFMPEEEADDDNGLLSADDELHYVFHKFIDDSGLEVSFTDIVADHGLSPSMTLNEVMQSESGAEQDLEHARTTSADDLEVAFFMVGNVSSVSPSVVCPGAIPSSAAVCTEQQTAVSEDTTMSATKVTAHSFYSVAEPSAISGRKSLSTVENVSEPYSRNVVGTEIETDTSSSIFETSELLAVSRSPSELENLPHLLRNEGSELETDFYVDSNLNAVDSETEKTFFQSDSNEMRTDVIVQKLSDSLSFFIELPAAEDVHVFDVLYSNVESMDVSTPTYTDDATTAQERASVDDDIVIGQSFEVVTPECIIEQPVSIDELKASLHFADDVSYGHSEQYTSYISDIIANAMQRVTDEANSEAMGICHIASEDDDMSSSWSKQILVTSAPLSSSYNWPAVQDEFDTQLDSLLSTVDQQLATDVIKYCSVDTADAVVLDTYVDNSHADEAVCATSIEPQEVPPVEYYLISYDVHQSQQLIVVDADAAADGEVMLQDLVQPLEHISSEGKLCANEADELHPDSESHPAVYQDAGQAADVATFTPTPTDIVEDFFMQYVLPVDSIPAGYSPETDTAAAGDVYGSVVDQRGVDKSHNVADVIVISAEAETDMDLDVESGLTSSMLEVQYEDMERDKVEQDQEDPVRAKQLEITAQTVVDIVINDAVAETDTVMSDNLATDQALSAAAASDETQLITRTDSSSLLQSPSKPHHKKSVHFADMHGLQLETIQHYDQPPEPDQHPASLEEFLSKLSAAAAERRAKWTEHRVGVWLCNSSIYLLACFELPSSQDELLERVRRYRVALESCSFDDLALAISGIVRVANIAFHKTVWVRYTVDHWTTQTDVLGEYIPRSNDGPTDRFSFTIILPPRKQFVIGSTTEFAICLVAGDGPDSEFWDNNSGRNYVVRCCSKAASSAVADVNTDSCADDNDDSVQRVES